METAAQRYRRLKAEKESGNKLHPVTCKCGFEWQCKKADKEFWVTSGILPMHLVEVMVNATSSGAVSDPIDIMKKMAAKEVIDSIVFSSKVVRYTAVEPAIKETPEGPNDISQEDVMTCCYSTLRDWQLKGGEQAPGLSNFP